MNNLLTQHLSSGPVQAQPSAPLGVGLTHSASSSSAPWFIPLPFTQLAPALRQSGYCIVCAVDWSAYLSISLEHCLDLLPLWHNLPPDGYLRDGGRYRRRRHSCFRVMGKEIHSVPKRPHWQPQTYNALHGGIERWYEPIDSQLLTDPVWSRLLVALAAVCSELKGFQEWFIEAHQFRIDTSDGIGRPTPEGAHRDGVDFVGILLIDRVAIKGGETRIFNAHGPQGWRLTLTQSWTLLMLDDEKVIHETTPIQPINPASSELGYRDTLVLTFRRQGFQGPQ